MLLSLADSLIPLHEEQLIIVVYVGEVADAHLFQLLLDLSHLYLAVLVLALFTHLPEDVKGVEVLLFVALLLLAELAEK